MRWVWVALATTMLAGAVVAGTTTVGAAAAGTTGGAAAGSDAFGERPPNVAFDESRASSAAFDRPRDESDGVFVETNATYTSDEPVTVTIGGQQRSLYAVYVYDENGTRAGSKRVSLTADEQTVSFDALSPGSYRVVVLAANSGEQVSVTFGVDGAYEPGVVPEVTVEQPADVVSVPVSLPNGTTRATVDVAGDRGAYRATATVVDRDGDGEVVLEWNTFYAGRGRVALRTAGDDAVVDASRERDLDGFLREGEYHLTARANGTVLDRGAIIVDLEPLYTGRMGVFEAPAAGSPTESFEQRVSTGRVETDEWLFVVVETQGVFGAVNATRDLRSVGPDQVVLSITPQNGNEGVRLTDADYVAVEEDRIVVGFAPESDALAVDTAYDVDFRIARTHPYRAGDEVMSVNVEIVAAGTEPDRPVVALESVSAPESVPADGTANFTVTLVNRGERTGTVPVSVTIGGHVTERDVVVPGNGQAVVDLSFDASRVLEGNRQYVVEANGSRETGTLAVGETGDEPTLGDRDDDDESIPGFGPVAAGVALAAVALGARRRGRTSR
ncbi:PGF-CTERM sorting domain-containing protein [Halorubellus sp. PRR65]|uniref:DUF7827 domain-containing protein n=1 Tax=Halorubellus sp. PRR65 TaxID=3098148 RepID=UPI002B25AFA7|nr:PGF-CTERM sorting domain-containing protein [Halorubellus sp. PRR65]